MGLTRPMRAAPSRWTETAFALAIGFLLNFLASAAMAAGLLATLQDVSQLTGVAGALGGLVAALVHFAAIGLAAEPPSDAEHHRRMIRRASVEGVFSVVVGGIVASYLTDNVAAALRLSDAGDLTAVGFGVGVLAWRVAPGVIGAARLLTRPQVLVALAMQKLGIKIVREGSET